MGLEFSRENRDLYSEEGGHEMVEKSGALR